MPPVNMEFKQLTFCSSSRVKFKFVRFSNTQFSVKIGLSVTQISLLLPWGVEHVNHAFSPLPICDPYPGSLPPLIPCADRPSREMTPWGAEVSNWNFIGPWTCIPGAVSAFTLEDMRPGRPRLRQTCLGNLNTKYDGTLLMRRIKAILTKIVERR